MNRRQFLCAGAAAGLALAAADEPEPEPVTVPADSRLGRGVNLGNTLEAPREGAWGLTLEADFFARIKDAGFDSVRLPVRWSARAGEQPPYTLDETFARRVDWALEQALSRGLAIVLNAHHYDEIFLDPDRHEARLAEIWRQIAKRYRDRPPELVFELLNEPHDKLTDERWNRMVPVLLATVRETNPTRAVVVGPGNWNALTHLDQMELPADRHLIATFHYYQPFEFTHQGASWVKGSDKWKGRTWTGTDAQREALQRDFAKAAAWAARHGRPLYLGEFGAFSAADLESRARWTRAVAREAERHKMSWAYWEFAAGFGVYDPQAHAWRKPLLDALLDRPA